MGVRGGCIKDCSACKSVKKGRGSMELDRVNEKKGERGIAWGAIRMKKSKCRAGGREEERSVFKMVL